ncbi:MAG: hypothetical protein AB7P49_02035 [Bdellovibrionales bacterium]
MSNPKKPSTKTAASPSVQTGDDLKKKKKNVDSVRKHINRLLTRHGIKSSKGAKRFLRRQVAYNLRRSRAGCEMLAMAANMQTLTPSICQALVAIRLDEKAFQVVTDRVQTAYDAIKNGDAPEAAAEEEMD